MLNYSFLHLLEAEMIFIKYTSCICKVKVILGGLPVDERWRELSGADAATDDAYQGLRIVQSWAEGK